MKHLHSRFLFTAVLAAVIGFSFTVSVTPALAKEKKGESTSAEKTSEEGKGQKEASEKETSQDESPTSPAPEKSSDKAKEEAKEPTPTPEARPTVSPELEKAHKDAAKKLKKDKEYVLLSTKDGLVTIELYRDSAPNTVENFKKLVSKGFYEGLIFHRVIPGFMAQGGCPEGTGLKGPGYTIDAEFNSRKHVEGTVAMARTMDPNSAGSQFYICFAPQPHLDNQYTVFGQVIEGMDHVHKIQRGDKMLHLSYVDTRSKK